MGGYGDVNWDKDTEGCGTDVRCDRDVLGMCDKDVCVSPIMLRLAAAYKKICCYFFFRTISYLIILLI